MFSLFRKKIIPKLKYKNTDRIILLIQDKTITYHRLHNYGFLRRTAFFMSEYIESEHGVTNEKLEPFLFNETETEYGVHNKDMDDYLSQAVEEGLVIKNKIFDKEINKQSYNYRLSSKGIFRLGGLRVLILDTEFHWSVQYMNSRIESLQKKNFNKLVKMVKKEIQEKKNFRSIYYEGVIGPM